MSIFENEGKMNYKNELSKFEKAASAGDESAFANIGLCHENGYGVKKDCQKVLEWYKKGVNAVDPQAMRNYGGMFDEGFGVRKDKEKAL
ncbi:MAG: sel1 repeat family protein [Peptostreptococcaceae bacterium]|nr:sel1 repeat family protein [Peptostreptococcaceae bacterium]